MKITLERQNDAYHMEARNESGETLQFDANPEIGGVGAGFRPMQAVLAAVGACSSIDVVSILKKQRQPLEDFRIELDGDRKPEGEANVFKEITIHFYLKGNLDESKVKKAVDLSMEKYCSVSKMIEKTANITWAYTIEN